jgi:hypothetical protein
VTIIARQHSLGAATRGKRQQLKSAAAGGAAVKGERQGIFGSTGPRSGTARPFPLWRLKCGSVAAPIDPMVRALSQRNG